MPSNHLILCRPLLLLPSIFPSIRVFSNESVLHIRRPKFWSFSFIISPSNEYSAEYSRRDKKIFLNDQCKEIEENNRIGKTRGLFKIIRNTKRTFSVTFPSFFPILLFSSISLHWSLMKAFLFLLAILWNTTFKWVCLSFSPLPSFSSVAQSCTTVCLIRHLLKGIWVVSYLGLSQK